MNDKTPGEFGLRGLGFVGLSRQRLWVGFDTTAAECSVDVDEFQHRCWQVQRL